MPERQTLRRARRAKRQGKARTTQAGEFVREEMHHVKSGKHGVKSRKQAIAIGLNKARRSGVEPGAPRGKAKRATGGRKQVRSRSAAAKRSRSKGQSRSRGGKQSRRGGRR